ncbi:MAG TPA: branched-chain amino acid ABC transporter permease, partial [Firmicutes bacterium]|nr:branched-chain amino acid ABC transporter permease [Bacillota bacterium]
MGKKNWLALLLFAIVVAVVPRILGDSYYISVLVFVGIYSIVTIGLSLLMGYAGQISLGHAAFFGIGAYTSGLLTTRCALSGWVALPAAIALAGLLAFLMGGPTLRLTGHYLA